MPEFQTEEQQVEAIKSFWQENGNSIIAGLIVGLGGFIGFNYYQDSKLADETKVTDAYQTMVDAGAKNAADLPAAADKFVANNAETSLAAFAEFALAKTAVESQDYAKAEKHLAAAVTKAADQGIKGIATVRLARVQMQQENYQEALTTLSAELPASFKATVEEAKGDVYLKQGKADLARSAYQAAIDADGLASSPALQMKLDDLAQAINLPN
ncbi:tetratricopeptide repeat protein [Endozoicomonas sp. G2_1]|uniref:YfgM family protein n=1 Tax=Endozoicomonas sp. G2_1 TaxID=2821091 RepID=UPI001AD9FC67|nr:tetratricopeptide repeat protein [Endozoicomonas sp. G2_1]